MVYN
jgi:hypothetical protein